MCIIDNKTLYTTVAQAVFRLRKLNIGHSINFYLLNIDTTDIDSSEKLYRMLKHNDKVNMINKHDLLIFQTVKSIIRKNLPIKSGNDFKQNYKEKIKYYYFEKTIDYDVKKLLDGIIDYEKATEIKMFKDINDENILTRLIYNIDTLSHDVSIEQEKQQNTEIEIQRESNFVKNNQYRSSMAGKINYVLNNNVLNNIEEHVFNISVKLTDNVYCLINIFNESYPIYKHKFIQHSFFIYLETKKILLLIPQYMLIYVHNKYLVFNTDMSVVSCTLIKLPELRNDLPPTIIEPSLNTFLPICSI